MSDKTSREQDGSGQERSGRDPKVVLVAGGVLLALALTGGVLVLGGGEPEQVTLAAVQAPPGVAAPLPEPSPSPSPVTVAPVGRARDPFRALHVAAVADSSAAGSSAAEPAAPGTPALPADGAPVVVPVPDASLAPEEALPTFAPMPEVPLQEPPVDPFPTGPTLGPVAPAPGASPAGSPAGQAATSVTLLRVLGDGAEAKAEFRVGGTTVTASLGEQLGSTELRLLSLQQDPVDSHWTAVLKDGAGEPFDAPIGASVPLG